MSLESEADLISANVTTDRTSQGLKADLRALDRLEARARQMTDIREKDSLLGKINSARNLVFHQMPAARERTAELGQQFE